MVLYKPVQITINAPGLAEVFIDLIVRHGPPRPPRLNCTLRLSSHDPILVIVDRLTKMVYYEPVQMTIDAPAPAVSYTPFELDCGYRPRVFYDDIE